MVGRSQPGLHCRRGLLKWLEGERRGEVKKKPNKSNLRHFDSRHVPQKNRNHSMDSDQRECTLHYKRGIHPLLLAWIIHWSCYLILALLRQTIAAL
mmetsp:Transcript_22404/g.48754  ORF Transcript_22404/g.48754 Transcript_22404/m.48754 type:complete len:96 (+) Transcript_22404:625-912(+)